MADPSVEVEDLGRVKVLDDEITQGREIALVRIGAFITNRAQLAFSEQKRGEFEWPERAVPNFPGIVAD